MSQILHSWPAHDGNSLNELISRQQTSQKRPFSHHHELMLRVLAVAYKPYVRGTCPRFLFSLNLLRQTVTLNSIGHS